MSQEVELYGVKIPSADWEATPASVKEVLLTTLQRFNERLVSLEAENAQFIAVILY